MRSADPGDGDRDDHAGGRGVPDSQVPVVLVVAVINPQSKLGPAELVQLVAEVLRDRHVVVTTLTDYPGAIVAANQLLTALHTPFRPPSGPSGYRVHLPPRHPFGEARYF